MHLGCHDGEVAAAQAFDQAAMLRHAHCLGPQGSHGDAALVTNFTPAFYQVRGLSELPTVYKGYHINRTAHLCLANVTDPRLPLEVLALFSLGLQ